jgi:hypothetical protein
MVSTGFDIEFDAGWSRDCREFAGLNAVGQHQCRSCNNLFIDFDETSVA